MTVPSPRFADRTGTRAPLETLAHMLMDIAHQLRNATDTPFADGPVRSGALDRPALARHLYQLRRRRDALFGSADMFGEPAWDILLDLYIAEASGKPVSVSSACIGAAAPQTTALRWLGLLADCGLVAREADPMDQRRVMVCLTPRAKAAMDEFLDAFAALPDWRATHSELPPPR